MYVDLDHPENLENPDIEAFLNEPDNRISADALYDVSPLPRDETPLQKSDVLEEIPTEIRINIVNTESPESNTPIGSEIVSGSASLYFTPDATTEKLSEISLN